MKTMSPQTTLFVIMIQFFLSSHPIVAVSGGSGGGDVQVSTPTTTTTFAVESYHNNNYHQGKESSETNKKYQAVKLRGSVGPKRELGCACWQCSCGGTCFWCSRRNLFSTFDDTTINGMTEKQHEEAEDDGIQNEIWIYDDYGYEDDEGDVMN